MILRIFAVNAGPVAGISRFFSLVIPPYRDTLAFCCFHFVVFILLFSLSERKTEIISFDLSGGSVAEWLGRRT